MTDDGSDTPANSEAEDAPYDEAFLRWVVELSHATLRDAEHTLAYPSALIGVVVFVLGTRVEGLLPSVGCSYSLQAFVWVVLVLGLVALAGGIWSVTRALHGDLVSEIKHRGTTGQFVSDSATRVDAHADRCRQLAFYRTLLDLSAEQAVANRGAAYVRTMLAAGFFIAARVALALAAC